MDLSLMRYWYLLSRNLDFLSSLLVMSATVFMETFVLSATGIFIIIKMSPNALYVYDSRNGDYGMREGGNI